ncbi:hypothetical protein MRB53_019487 [Persea americana]|uniref:Uncharacterized protein n=1 Tax=Persea americana TaxID=3435 RepID=A0ACC2KYT5_PERAE|nr:hypothetical protein MRB53_019487 [Persea americana]
MLEEGSQVGEWPSFHLIRRSTAQRCFFCGSGDLLLRRDQIPSASLFSGHCTEQRQRSVLFFSSSRSTSFLLRSIELSDRCFVVSARRREQQKSGPLSARRREHDNESSSAAIRTSFFFVLF